jgi:sialate O-acetylesterase
MIAPLIPLAIRGVIWYQGEDDAPKAYAYREIFKNLIRDWRENWQIGPFPFYFVQLANWESPMPLCYAEAREAQLLALSEPSTGMAVTIDVGQPDNVHFKNKQAVGHRLALIALAKTYGRDNIYSGPIYKSMQKEGERVRIRFDHVDGGLVANNGELTGFTIADSQEEYEPITLKPGAKPIPGIRKFHPAEARIEGDAVLVWSKMVKDPDAVRYAWANCPTANLYNQAGLPAAPFRTDNWKLLTQP